MGRLTHLSRASEEEPFLRSEVGRPLEAARACEAQVRAERGAQPFSHQASSTCTPASARSIRGSIRPTKRSRNTIGSTYQPQRRLAGGRKSSHTYSKSNR